MERLYLNNDWYFNESFSEDMINSDYDWSKAKKVRIPHTVKELDYHYCNEEDYQMLSGYGRVLYIPKYYEGKTLLLTFEGIAHRAEVYINGTLAIIHNTGYTAFTADISELVNYDEKNYITVKCDSRESLNTPPFGYVIDYLTYGGIYRDVYLDVKEETYIKDVFLHSKISELHLTQTGYKAGQSTVFSEICIACKKDRDSNFRIEHLISFHDKNDYKLISSYDFTGIIEDTREFKFKSQAGEVNLWDINSPNLYDIKTVLYENNEAIDERVIKFGFRKAIFKKNGFFLNGRKLKIRGLNRHQSYAYVGYAMPDSMQKLDADILKNELGVNAVRTSHYPQSHAFIDRCDELGLLVFTEFPGWQHIGDEEWKNQALINLDEMVVQYRNHPSIMLWGVRINESVDDDEFYTKTNELCRKLDPSRQTGGVRCYKKGSFLEDVYTYNDFSHRGNNKGCDRKSEVTPDMDKPYFISEYNGHMYPTKTFDDEEHRVLHMKRHANVLNEVSKQADICGCFGWCMFDYNTHKDFGSGDRICYHGVMDMFRNKKLAADVYSVFQSKEPVLRISSTMDKGEHPASRKGDVYILTNADSVKMYKNDEFIKEYKSTDTEFKFLKHGPILVDDYIGDAILENEPDLDKRQIENIKIILNEVARNGMHDMDKAVIAKAFLYKLKYNPAMEKVYDFYSKYVEGWGNEAITFKFVAFKNDQPVKEVIISPPNSRKLSVTVDHTNLEEINTYDVSAIRIQDVDNNGNVLPFSNDPLILSVEGDIELIGPDVISLQGGMTGTYVKSTGKTGEGKLTIKTTYGCTETINFTCKA
ncbi:MAG: glycoside hydrolase family 2 protein [Lachnospiraceae bacterium]|nr:glycoside hydrolase family 2 protein [Lachnospiraceae bacterium]